MTVFVVANLGDAALTVPSGTVNGTTTISDGGVTFVDNTSAAPIVLTLDTALDGFVLLKDVAGNAGEYPITISCSAGIDGGTTLVMAVPYQWAWLFWNGSSYSVIG
jgi:hypothetical protein